MGFNIIFVYLYIDYLYSDSRHCILSRTTLYDVYSQLIMYDKLPYTLYTSIKIVAPEGGRKVRPKSAEALCNKHKHCASTG
jgi:hypothetical protein